MSSKNPRAATRRPPAARTRPRAKPGAVRAVTSKPALRGGIARDRDPAAAFCAAANDALERGDHKGISDASLRRVLTVAVKLYAAKMDGREKDIPPFENNRVNATETVVASCAMIRSAGLNLFDVAMWFRRSAAGL